MACAIQYPSPDTLFIEAPSYDFRRWDLYGICAWYVHDYEDGYAALLKALRNRPMSVHTRKNLKFYKGKVKNFDSSLLPPPADNDGLHDDL